jgi:NAD-dependent deacetylase
MDRIYDELSGADLFVSIGTSGNVYPAASFVSAARSAGIPTMEINLEPSENAAFFDTGRYGKATDAVPAWVTEMLTLPRRGGVSG